MEILGVNISVPDRDLADDEQHPQLRRQEAARALAADTTTDVATLEALLERVKQATGRDWTLNHDLAQEMHNKWWTLPSIPNLTGCLSAATALADEMFPGCDYGVSRYDGQYSAHIGYKPITAIEEGRAIKGVIVSMSPYGKSPTAPLAILVALLQAKIAIVSGVTEEQAE